MTKRSTFFTPRRWFGLATAGLGALALAAAFAPAATAAPASAASVRPASHVVHAGGGPIALHKVGTVNLLAVARADAKRKLAPAASSTGHPHVAPLGLPPSAAIKAGKASAARAVSAGSLMNKFAGNVKGAHGFDGITGAIQSAANAFALAGLSDLAPPDQGLAVGPSSAGTVAVEFVNNALDIYSLNGNSLLGAIPSYQVFGQAPTPFFSDPRAYRDPQSGHWFLTEFIYGDGNLNNDGTPLGTQFIAVSQTTSPFGPYSIFAIDTSDLSNTAGNCPCFGDFDQVGMDNSGFYIATNQFSVDQGNFNGSVLYAISKSGLISAARGFGSPPVVQEYVVPFTSDPFAAYHLSPSAVTPGSSAPNTEYFVESNSNQNFGNALEVYALLHTAVLNSGGRPQMVASRVATEAYSFPPNAIQRSGSTPFSCIQLLSCSTATIDTDFNAVQEVTYASGRLFAELDTGFDFGTGQNSGAAWFVLAPKAGAHSISVSKVSNGYVESSQEIMYPVIGVNKSGLGYMTFAVSSATRYPSAAYIVFHAAKGPQGPIHIAANGVNPLDDFACYPPFGSSCRYGDYSMAQYYNGKIYMATEYVSPQPRDVFTNWGTRVWYAPVP